MSKQDPWLRKWGAGAMSHPSNPGCPPPTCVPTPADHSGRWGQAGGGRSGMSPPVTVGVK